jgi:uncharacterized protein (UPF0261 family)
MTSRTGIWVIGTLDTKREAVRYLAERIRAHGHTPVVMDVSLSPAVSPAAVDVPAGEVASAAGADIAALRRMGRTDAMRHMMAGAASVLATAHRQGEVQAVIAVGGSGGTTIASHAMRDLPIGVPKIIVSTVAAGDTRQYVGASDIALFSSVVDVMGLNAILERVLSNAAAAVVGMAQSLPVVHARRRVVAMTSFGVTTPFVQRCRTLLESRDFEVIVFHARGSGGIAMERLIRAGEIDAVLDATTTELADEVAGGAMSAGPDRLEAAGAVGIPQLVVPGALDVVNFGAADRLPEHLRDRLHHAHNPGSLVMRSSADEMAAVGRLMAAKLNRASGPAGVLIPTRGFSDYDRRGGVFFDPAADAAFTAALRADLDPRVPIEEADAHINDEPFADRCVERLLALLGTRPLPAR